MTLTTVPANHRAGVGNIAVGNIAVGHTDVGHIAFGCISDGPVGAGRAVESAIRGPSSRAGPGSESVVVADLARPPGEVRQCTQF